MGLREAGMLRGQAINFCRPEQVSFCTALNQKEQSGCSFYEKSLRAERCMYFIFDEYCDCLKAQVEASAAAGC
jgi:hypothetical protein